MPVPMPSRTVVLVGASLIDENEWGQKRTPETRQVVFGPVYRQDRGFPAPSEAIPPTSWEVHLSTHERLWVTAFTWDLVTKTGG